MKWCVLDCADPMRPVFRCKRCGGTRPVRPPMTLADLNREDRSFEDEHRGCGEANP